MAKPGRSIFPRYEAIGSANTLSNPLLGLNKFIILMSHTIKMYAAENGQYPLYGLRTLTPLTIHTVENLTSASCGLRDLSSMEVFNR